MIKAAIITEYPHHIRSCSYTTESVFIADYTEKTKTESIKRGTEVFASTPPPDINYFHLQNDQKLEIGLIVFNNQSFTYANLIHSPF